jgi:hypothetical protein
VNWIGVVADREGFEPSLPLTVNTLSKRARSTTLPSVRYMVGREVRRIFAALAILFVVFFARIL